MRTAKEILVIDDDPDAGWILSRVFDDQGDKVTVAKTATAGIEKFSAHGEFDLVFLDIKLADANGLDVLAQIKRLDPLAKVIVISAFGSPENKEVAFAHGARAFLDKPIQLDEMIRLTKELIGR